MVLLPALPNEYQLHQPECSIPLPSLSQRMAKKTFRFNLLRKKSKGPPGGIEVKTAIASNNFDTTNSSTANGSKDKNSINGNTAAPIIVAEDEVSAMTPATGMPPDSPDRLRNLPSLLRPISQTTISDKMIDDKEEEDKDHAEAFDVDFPDEDELSAMTPVSPDRWEEGGGSKKRTVKKYQLRWKGVSPRNILLGGDNDDACSPGVTVYEDDEASSSGWEHRQQFQQQNHEQKATPPATISKPTNILLQSPLSSSSSTSSSSSWLTRTKYFQKAIDSSFEMIDVDKSGDVTLEELYAGLLLIHLNMAVYVGPPACRVRLALNTLHDGLNIFFLHCCHSLICIHFVQCHIPASEQSIRHRDISSARLRQFWNVNKR